MKLIEENSNKAVIATKYITDKNSVIVSVFYDEDGDWQFFSQEEVNEDDARVLSVQQILKIDNTLADIPSLSKGQSAFRVNKDSLWQIQK
jgi:hypothetical protein